MKANFNIAKNIRNSRSISALSALRKLQSLGLLLCALMIGSLQVWGATAEWNFSEDGLSSKSPITLTYGQGSAANNTTIINGTLRLYPKTTNGNGSWIKFTAADGYEITAVSVTAASNQSLARYGVDAANTGAALSSTFSYSTGTATVSSLHATTFAIKNGQSSGDNKTLQFSSITITYEATASGYSVTYNNGGHGTAPSSTTASNVTLSAITGVTGYTCTGWKANVAVTNTSTSATISAGTLITNGTNVTLSAATTFTAQWEVTKYTVTFAVNVAGYGSVSQATVTNVPHGTIPTSSSNTVTVNGTTVTATPHAQDADYNYVFSSWSGIPASVTSAVTITANFTRTARTLTNYRTSCSDPSCDEPTALATSSVTSTSVGLTITDPANTGSYEVYFNMTGTAPSSGTGASRTYNTKTPTVTGLESGRTYYMWVRAKCDESTKSNWVALTSTMVTTTCGDPTPSAPSSIIDATTGQNGGVTLSWTGDPNNYELYWHQSNTEPDAGQSPSQSVDGAKTYNVTGLTAGTYYWWVRSNCGSGKGPWVAGTSFTIKGIKVGGTTPVNFGTVNQNSLVEDKFITVTGVGLAGGTNITATMSSGSPFSLDPTSVAYNASAAQVNISASTATAGTFNQTLTLSYGGTYTATVTVMMTVQAVYTVTYVHHDKGTFSGASTTQYVPTNATTITLPTVTDVSCGFYDTFEGWIASGSEYSESTSKPATVYAGGSSYTVSSDVTLRALYSKCEGEGGEVYAKVTTDPGDWSGTYLIINEDYGKAMNGSETQANLVTTSNNVAVTISNSQVVSNSTTDTYAFTIAPHSTAVGRYSIRSHSGYYIGSNATSSNTINATETETTYSHGLSITDGVLKIGTGKLNGSSVEYRLMYLASGGGSPIFKYYANTQQQVCLYKKQSLCTKYYATDPSCVKPVGVHITYNANAGDATMDCSTSNRTYKVVSGDNKYPQLASAYSFCTNATRAGYTLVGWNTRADGLGTTYDIDHSYSNLPVSGELDGENWVTLNVYAMWASAVSFNLGNATGGTGVPAVVEEDGGFMLPEPTAAQIGTIPCGYSFYGWSESSVGATQTKPTLFMPGTKYTGSARTLYAVYRLADGSVDPNLFSLSYTYSATKYYVSYPISSTADAATQLRGSTSSAEAAAFGVESVDFQTYKALYYMNEGVKEYLYWYTGDGTSIRHTPTKPTDKGWTINDGVGTKQLVPSNATDRNIKFNSDSSDPRFRPYQDNSSYLTVEEASGTSYTYATNPSCETTATLQFVTNGGTLNYPTAYDASNYVDLTVGTTVYLPTATFAGEWVFEGWMKGSELPSQATSPAGDPNFYTVTLNTTQYTASPAGTTTFYAVYSKTVDDKQWDPTAEGTYKIYAIMSDGTTKKYMPAWGGTQTTLSPTTACPETGEYTITPGTGEHTGQYKITHSTYTLGVVSDTDTKFKNVADAWWNIEASTSGKGTYRITIVGSSNRCLSYSGFDTFGNYTISQVNSPSQPNYRDVEIGECIYTEYTSTPENIPYITITGSPVKITSTNGERVYAPTKIHIEAHNFSTTRTIHFSATNGFATNPASVNTAANGAYSGDIDIYYQPTTDGDGSIVSSVLTASQSNGPAAEHVSQTFSAIRGRNLPQNFVIAVKSGEQWYALPDDCHSSGTPKAVPIEVNDPNAPTAASLVPHNVEWRLSDVVNSGDRPKDKVYFYEPNSTYNYTLYAGSAPNIQTNAQLSNVTGENSYTYEWGLTTSDLCAYTIGNANVGKNISINSAGNFGTHASGIVSSTLYLLPITAYYEPAAMQVLEWKANSVVVMYTGTQTTATTKVGDNSASGSQTLASQKLTHGIYELTTGQALTDNAGQTLKVSFGGSAEIAFVTIPIIINSDVTADADHASEDVIIVSGGKLTAAATKYSFHNIYVYGGGKLKIASGSQLGVNNIILRAGGVTTNGSGGSATYAYTYPQLELGGTLTSTQANIKYEYITDYDHWYQFCLPFNGTLSSITYPQEYYGDNVTAANTGSWVIKRYAGEVRATGNYNAWVDIESESATSVTAGHGYIYWGAPKKVTIGGDKQRQAWGIQRITMPVTASAATTAETADKNISVDSYSDVATSDKPNDQGWNLVGNPYMVNLTDLSSNSMIAGQLVHTETVPWDGKWRNNGDGVRYVTIPDNHFDSYVAKTASVASGEGDFMPGRAFFVQIAEGASTLTFAAANRASLTPARFAQTAQSVDIETGIVMSDESKHDEVNFWIKEDKTAEYEYNADYPKTPNNTNFNIYGVHSHGDLSWIAISPEIAEGSMAIGYQVPTAGEYRLSLSETYVSDKIDQLLVTDHEMSPEITTNLLTEDYFFQVNQAETNNTRFTVSIHLAPQTPTDIGNVPGEGLNADHAKPQKFIYHDKLYILRNGMIYDATGKQVKGGLK